MNVLDFANDYKKNLLKEQGQNSADLKAEYKKAFNEVLNHPRRKDLIEAYNALLVFFTIKAVDKKKVFETTANYLKSKFRNGGAVLCIFWKKTRHGDNKEPLGFRYYDHDGYIEAYIIIRKNSLSVRLWVDRYAKKSMTPVELMLMKIKILNEARDSISETIDIIIKHTADAVLGGES